MVNEVEKLCNIRQILKYQIKTTYGINTTKQKEKNEMLSIYGMKQHDHITNHASTKRKEIFNENKDLKTLLDLIKKYKISLYIDPMDFMNEDQKTRLLEIDNQEKQEYDKLDDLLCEVKAQLDMCETYEQKQNIYKLYNIINEEGTLNV